MSQEQFFLLEKDYRDYKDELTQNIPEFSTDYDVKGAVAPDFDQTGGASQKVS